MDRHISQRGEPANRTRDTVSNGYIAVVDDDESVCRSLARLLGAFSYQVQTYQSGREFLDSLSAAVPACLLLDLRMDDMTGLEVLYHLVVRGLGIPAIVVTAHDDPGMRLLCESVGTVAFLLKPTPSESLLEAIRSSTGVCSKIELTAPLAESERGTATEISTLPAYQRIRCYRALAREIRAEAAMMESSVYKDHLLIAEQWEMLAVEVEKRFIH
jgi:FixJ family two-component response regulator